MSFLFDEQMPAKLADALRVLGEPVEHILWVPDLGRGASDDRILHYAGRWDHRIISMDRRILRNPHLRSAYMSAGVGVYFFKAANKKSTDFWEVVRALIKHWQMICSHAEKTKCPYVMTVQERGGVKRYL